MDKVLWRGVDVLSDGQDIASLRKMVLVSVMRRHFHTGDLVAGLDSPETLLAKLPSHELSTVADIAKGKTGIKDAKPGPYPLVVTAEARSECDHFDYEGPAVVIPMVSSTGHGDASLKRIHYQEGQYAVGTILAVVRPLNPDQLSARYLYEYLSAFKEELLVSRMVGTANVSLTVKKLGDVPVPLIPIESQRQIERLMALCDRLEADQADAEAAHAQLVQALLDSLTQATDAADVRASWQRLSEHFHTLFTTEASIDALKQTVLQLAVMGKLVPQWTDDEPASALMMRLRISRNQWLEIHAAENAECRTMQRKLSLLNEPNAPFPIPRTWQPVRLIDCCQLLVDCHNKTAPYVAAGIPIIRTSNIRERRFRLDDLRFVSEETYEFWSRRCPPQPGDIMFTREAPMGEAAIIPEGEKYCLGQRTMLIRPMHDFISNEYLLIALTEPHLLERASREAIGSTVKHLRVGDVENLAIPLPPLSEQQRIVAKVDELMALCDQLKAQLAKGRQQHAQLATVLVEQAVA